MKKKNIIILFLLVFSTSTLFAQGYIDDLYYSKSNKNHRETELEKRKKEEAKKADTQQKREVKAALRGDYDDEIEDQEYYPGMFSDIVNNNVRKGESRSYDTDETEESNSKLTINIVGGWAPSWYGYNTWSPFYSPWDNFYYGGMNYYNSFYGYGWGGSPYFGYSPFFGYNSYWGHNHYYGGHHHGHHGGHYGGGYYGGGSYSKYNSYNSVNGNNRRGGGVMVGSSQRGSSQYSNRSSSRSSFARELNRVDNSRTSRTTRVESRNNNYDRGNINTNTQYNRGTSTNSSYNRGTTTNSSRGTTTNTNRGSGGVVRGNRR